ncbi:hypothetical protein ACU8NH_09010 [Rhizobium leguminosarum]
MSHHHIYEDGFTFRSLLYDLLGAASAGLFVAAISIWLPYIVQHQ